MPIQTDVGPFSITPKWIRTALPAPIRADACMVWVVLWEHADRRTKQAYPSVPTIADAAGIGTRKHVRKCLDALAAIGAVRVEHRRDPDNPSRSLSNLYTLIAQRQIFHDDAVELPDADCPHPVDKGVGPDRPPVPVDPGGRSRGDRKLEPIELEPPNPHDDDSPLPVEEPQWMRSEPEVADWRTDDARAAMKEAMAKHRERT